MPSAADGHLLISFQFWQTSFAPIGLGRTAPAAQSRHKSLPRRAADATVTERARIRNHGMAKAADLLTLPT
jgi:hypothetical protein